MRSATLAGLVAMTIAIAGCGGDDEVAVTTSSSTSPQATTSPSTTTDDAGGSEEKPDTANPEGPTDQAIIEKNAAAVVGSNEPDAVCEGLATQRYVDETYGSPSGCRAAVSAQPMSEVTVTEIEVSGGRASAVAVPDKGPLAGEEIDVSLVYEDGDWLVDKVRADVPAGP